MKSKKRKGQHVPRVQFSGPKSSEEQKKVITPSRLSFILISPLHHESFLHLSAGEGAAAHPWIPPWIYKVINLRQSKKFIKRRSHFRVGLGPDFSRRVWAVIFKLFRAFFELIFSMSTQNIFYPFFKRFCCIFYLNLYSVASTRLNYYYFLFCNNGKIVT